VRVTPVGDPGVSVYHWTLEYGFGVVPVLTVRVLFAV